MEKVLFSGMSMKSSKVDRSKSECLIGEYPVFGVAVCVRIEKVRGEGAPLPIFFP